MVPSKLSSELVRRQLASGGWPAVLSSAESRVEPTCYSVLALGSESQQARRRAQAFLLRAQNPNGSWPVFAGDDHNGSWLTSLVAIALGDLAAAMPARLNGIHWLLASAGRESSWLWKWKFRTTDRHVQFDPDKFGWPWFPDTVSWIVPTAFAVLALKQLPGFCDRSDLAQSRVDRGIAMLIDRACPGGGWNAGNGVVYGIALRPHPDDTAIALLALRSLPHNPAVQASVHYLERAAPALAAPWSLSWTILALAAHGRPTTLLRRALLALPDLLRVEDTSTLALASLALDHQRALNKLGVRP